jgi:anaerobic selenocysteine-containing dehydrogenase
VVALNLAVGAVGRAGGYVAGGGAPFALPAAPAMPAARGPAVHRVDGAGTSTLEVVEQSPARLVDRAVGPSYPLEVLLVHGVNPAHEWAGGPDVARWLEQPGLVVVMTTVPDETAERADLLLPETSFLESWGLLPAPPYLPFDYAGLQQPVIEPVYQSRSFEDVWFALARKLGGPVAAAAPPGRFDEWLPSAAAGLFAASRGTLATGVTPGRIADFMESRGWKVAGPATREAFWSGLREAGAWVDAPRTEHSPDEVLGPGVERFDFWPERLMRNAGALAGRPPAAETIYAGEPAPPSGDEGTFPLRLLLFDTNTLWAGRTARTPLMLELAGHREEVAWDSWVEIHPDTARAHGIADADQVRIESATGWLVARARVAHVVPRDAVAMPRGLGHRHFGRFANGVGADPMPLLPGRSARWTGAPVHAARVRIAGRQA